MQVAEYIEFGKKSKCPFCLGRSNRWPSVGTSIVFLTGINAGQEGIVVTFDSKQSSVESFFVKMHRDADRGFRIVMPNNDAFIESKEFIISDWILPLSIEDNFFVHESMIQMLNCVMFSRASLIPIISTCWQQRLPVSGAEIWRALQAHGVDAAIKSITIDDFEFGIALLTRTSGRPAVRRRRMSPMSKGRYSTPSQQEIRLRLFVYE